MYKKKICFFNYLLNQFIILGVFVCFVFNICMDFILYKLYAIIYGCLHENDGGKSDNRV
jgi:hypothetical protein